MSGEVVAEKIHAELGASVAPRWIACPGSIQLSRGLPEAPSSSYAEEGTQAHAVAELSLNKGVEPEFFVGMEVEGAVVPEEMVEHVKVYTDHCRRLMREADSFWIERRISLAKLNPPGPMFGTSDFSAYIRANRQLHVVDLKFGVGVVVDVVENEQLLYYALGVVLSLDLAEYPVDEIEITVVQPRAVHSDGVIRSWTITYEQLIEFAADLMDAARKTQEPNAPLVAGSHCRFCPASGICPAQRDRALAIAEQEFSVVETEFVPPAPETIPAEKFAEILSKLHILEDWASSMRAAARGKLERGESVPGFKLVATRATRQWANEDDVAQALEAEGKYTEEDLYEPRDLKSVAQIEKLMGKKAFKTSPVAAAVVKRSSGYKMVPAHDPAPAISLQPIDEAFALLPAGESQNTQPGNTNETP